MKEARRRAAVGSSLNAKLKKGFRNDDDDDDDDDDAPLAP